VGNRGHRALLRATRLWLPLAIALAGVVLIVVGGADVTTSDSSFAGFGSSTSALGLVLVGVAVMVAMLNWLFRLGVKSNRDREREEQARKYFDEHGRWPGE
jgi:membrane protein implicated in regulation of membrane protease activity